MKKLFLIPSVVCVLLLLAPTALACGGGDEAGASSDTGCPSYTVSAGDDSVGAGANEDGQFAVYAGLAYVFWDYTPYVTGTDHLFSTWIYFESNGESGAQRHDASCQEVPPEDADVYPC